MKKLILVAGPESTGTRIFTEIITSHPMIMGTPDASNHGDILDDVWRALEEKKIRKAIQTFPDSPNDMSIVTRRSLPHSRTIGKPAVYMNFANLHGLYKLSLKLKFELIVLITTRSTAAHLAAWTITRASPAGSLEKAKYQYAQAYCYLFKFINKSKVPFFFISMEALMLDQQAYIQSIFQLLGLPPHSTELDIHTQVNQKRYSWYSNHDNGEMITAK